MKRILSALLVLLMLTGMMLTSSAHSGRTDGNGGHHSGSSYHYHHGYPAHQHTNGVCPYNYDDKTGENSGSSGGGSGSTTDDKSNERVTTTRSNEEQEESSFRAIAKIVVGFIFGLLVFSLLSWAVCFLIALGLCEWRKIDTLELPFSFWPSLIPGLQVLIILVYGSDKEWPWIFPIITIIVMAYVFYRIAKAKQR